MSLAWRRRLAVVAGGVVGSASRIAVTDHLDPARVGWPWGTFVVNVAGALALGYLVAFVFSRTHPDSLVVPLAGVGALGAFTTFSSLALQTWTLFDAGRGGLAAAYALGSTAAGLAAAAVGVRAGETSAVEFT